MHEQAGELTITWNMERAKQAGLNLNKQNWKQYPRQMLAARCIAEGVRALYPACLDGLYLVEEVQDFDKPFNNQKSNNKVIDTQAESIDNSKYNIETNTYTIDDAEQYNTVPNGKNKGKLWKNLDIETLDKALQYYKEKNEDNYSNVIEKILLEKIEREKQQNENNEATDIKVSEDEDVYNNKEDEYMFGDDEDEIEDRDDEIIDFGE